MVREQGLDPVDIPDVVGMPENYIQGPVLNTRSTIQRFTRLRIALIGQLSVAVNDMITAPLKFAGDRRLASAGNAFDQIVSDAHPIASGRSPRRKAVAFDIKPRNHPAQVRAAHR